MVFLRHCLKIVLTLHLLAKIAEFPRDLIVKIRLSLRVAQIKLTLEHTDLKHKCVLRMVDALLKRILSQILDKLIGILVGRHADDPARHPRVAQDPDRAQRRLHTCTVTVVRQEDILRVFFDQPSLPRGERRPERRHRLCKSCLVHADDIHISLT